MESIKPTEPSHLYSNKGQTLSHTLFRDVLERDTILETQLQKNLITGNLQVRQDKDLIKHLLLNTRLSVEYHATGAQAGTVKTRLSGLLELQLNEQQHSQLLTELVNRLCNITNENSIVDICIDLLSSRYDDQQI